jgi:hypothetical protein
MLFPQLFQDIIGWCNATGCNILKAVANRPVDFLGIGLRRILKPPKPNQFLPRQFLSSFCQLSQRKIVKPGKFFRSD